MFKNMAADLMGISDIGKIIEPKDYDKTDIDDYIFHEDHEKIFFLIKAKTDEYCFHSSRWYKCSQQKTHFTSLSL